jgi:hypothetical protein
VELEFITEELPRDVKVFAADDDDMLTVKELFRDNRGESACLLGDISEGGNTEEVAFAVDDNEFLEGSHRRGGGFGV